MKRTDNNEMRDNILDAVIDCKIIADGSEVSLSQVASKAGISERTLNRYFPDKEMMQYYAAVRYLYLRYTGFLKVYRRQKKDGLNGREKLKLLLKTQITRSRKMMPEARTFVRAYSTLIRTAMYRKQKLPPYDAELKALVIDLINEGVSDGSVTSPSAPEELYRYITATYIGLLTQCIYTCTVEKMDKEKIGKLFIEFDIYLCGLDRVLRPEKTAEE
jgi:AcrR family transcriptional regulator